MRFFAHDGKDVHGPAVLDELIKLPGFDGDTLVCPVGSENSADWKPALAYPSFREALLAPAPRPAPLPPPAPAPVPLAPIPLAPAPLPTTPCPRCGRANPEDARFCNGCAARMDGREEAPALVPAAAPAPEPERMFARAPEPAPEPVFVPSDPLVLAPEPVVDAPEPVPEPAAAPASSTWRKTLIASFAGATVASAGLGWWLLRPAPHAEPPVADLTMPAPAAPAAAAPAAPAPVLPPVAAVAAPPQAPAAAAPPPAPARAPKAAAKVDLNDLTKASPPPSVAKRARRKARKPKPAPPVEPVSAAPAADETLIESHDKSAEPAPPGEAPAAESAAPAAPPASEDRGFLLPGVPRRPASVTKPKSGSAAPASSASTAQSAKPVAAPTDASAAATDAPDDGTTKQVREQFVFCAQLLSQGAYADHFDTCLCADARQAAPYRGRRGYYAASMKKAESAGTLATSAAVKGIVLDGPIAKVTADWKSSAADKPRTETENWQLEDGLWCRYP